MADTDQSAFKKELKRLIIDATGQDLTPDDIPDDAPLFGRNACLELDSVDGLQISMALQRQHGVRITDSKVLRRVLKSVDTLAAHLEQQRP